MKNIPLLVLVLLLGNRLAAQTDFEWEKQVSGVKATVTALGDGETFVIVPANNANMRYISRQLPEEYKKDGLAITFNGWIGKIPPNVRMLGTPLKLTKVWVSCADKKKHGLKKAKYVFN